MNRLLFHILAITVLAAVSSSCVGTARHDGQIPLDEQEQQQPGNTALVQTPINTGNDSGASVAVPAGVTITSASAANGTVEISVFDLTHADAAAFEGDIFGGASFTPADAVFSSPVTVSIPVYDAGGPVNIYYLSDSASVSAATSQMHRSGVSVVGGRVSFETTHFGTFICGMANSDMQEDEEQMQQEEEQQQEEQMEEEEEQQQDEEEEQEQQEEEEQEQHDQGSGSSV